MAHAFPKIQKYIKAKYVPASEAEAKIVGYAEAINRHINDELDVVSSNLPAHTKKDKERAYNNEALVYVVQNESDKILDSNLSIYDKIIAIAGIVENSRAGNCQHKTFLAFKNFLNRVKDIELDLEIKYCHGKEGHFFLIVNGIVCDPWADIVYPVRMMPKIKDLDNDKIIFDGEIKHFYSYKTIIIPEKFIEEKIASKHQEEIITADISNNNQTESESLIPKKKPSWLSSFFFSDSEHEESQNENNVTSKIPTKKSSFSEVVESFFKRKAPTSPTTVKKETKKPFKF